MRRNRKLSIRLEKDAKADSDERANDKVFEDRLALTHSVLRDLGKGIFVGICGYVVLDTIRQVLIARNTDIQVFD